MRAVLLGTILLVMGCGLSTAWGQQPTVMITYASADAEQYPYFKQTVLRQLRSVAASAGVGASDASVWQLHCEISSLGKNVSSSSPTKIIGKWLLLLTLKDQARGQSIDSKQNVLMGLGETEEAAMRTAFNNWKTGSIEAWLKEQGGQIKEDYAAHCSNYLDRAAALQSAQKYEQALALTWACQQLLVCSEQANAQAKSIHQDYLKLNCDRLVTRARSLYSAEPNADGAQKAAAVLMGIGPQADCIAQARRLADEIKEDLGEQRDRLLQMLSDDRAAQRSQEARRWEAIEAIGVAWGANQVGANVTILR